ncbi:hypothetical protein HYS47_04350 [Candidatus Woesearchaeota archaeon]|nr:hypothetical protein [Candidatus Woesearchaeota archaeon]
MLPLLNRFHAAPLSSGLFSISILGAILTFLYYDDIGASFGFTFLLFFIILLIASFISMEKADVDATLALDHKRGQRGRG